ncbi:MAG: hypothetical protein N4A70_18110 [Pelagimonas sp.]|jgi:hypothetical protein|nr:hypothetical protein [Pelagimonas sp.]
MSGVIFVAVFMSATYRVLPLSVGDTLRTGLVALVIFLSSMAASGKLKIGFISQISAILIPASAMVILNIFTGRSGYYAGVVWFQFFAFILVGNAVYNYKIKELRILVIVVMTLLAAQWVFIKVQPSVFASWAHAAGVRDNFTLYSAHLDRIYYGYFNANTAAYTIWYLILAWISLNLFARERGFEYWVVLTVLAFLLLETGGRGVVLIAVLFCIAWFLFRRRTATSAALIISVVFVFTALPLLDVLIDIYNSRTRSNIQRFEALRLYMQYISESPLVGKGVNQLRAFVAEDGLKPSHNFPIEMIATFGVFVGTWIIYALLHLLVFRAKTTELRIIGIFALAPGMLNNSLFVMWGFFPLIVPVLIAASNRVTSLQNQTTKQKGDPAQDRPQPSLS